MASRKRAHISFKTLLCSELIRRTDAQGRAWIPYEHAKLMTEDQLLSLFERHHGILHSFGGSDHFANLELLPIAEHRRLTRERDVPIAAKTKRLEVRHRALLLYLKTHQRVPEDHPRKIPSRPWPPKGSRPMGGK